MYLESCTKDQLLEFYAEFDATEESVNRDVQYLIKWIEKEPHLPNVTGKIKKFTGIFFSCSLAGY